MLIGVALFLKFGCHGGDYIDGMLTGRAVAHKWFRDRKHAFEIRYRQLKILWRLRDNVKSHGQLALLSCYSFYKSNNWTAEDTAETSKNSYESFRSILLEISISTVNYRLAPIHELAKWGPRIRTRLWCAAFTYFITRRHLYRKNDHLTVESRLLCRHGSMVSVSLISARCFLLSCGFLSA